MSFQSNAIPKKPFDTRIPLYDQDGTTVLTTTILPSFDTPPQVLLYRNNFFLYKDDKYVMTMGYICHDL